MAMASVACWTPLTSLSSTSPSVVWLMNPPTPSTASLRFDRPHFQLKCRPDIRTRREARRSRGAAFASIRDAEELVQSGVVRPVSSREVSGLLLEEGYMLLDVRPIWEREKAYVTGSYHVPLFVEDLDTGGLTFLKKGIQAGQGGWWLGQKLTTRNEKFVEQVQAAVPLGQKLVVVCGEGLRSLLALEELNDAGFEQLAWMSGGFNTVREQDFPNIEGRTKLRFATVGGASEYILKFALLVSGVINLVKRPGSVDTT